MLGFLYGQTCYNMLKNSIHLNDYVAFAKTHGYDFLTITDPNMHGYYKFYNECIKHSIKPLIGLELILPSCDDNDNKVLLYALNLEGLYNLLKISSLTKITKAPIELCNIKRLTQSVILVTAGMKTDVNRIFNTNDTKLFNQRIKIYQGIFDKVYIGISNQEEHYKKNNIKLYEYLKKNKIKSLPLHQTYYLKEEDEEVCEILHQIGGTKREFSKGNYAFPNKGLLKEEFDEFEGIFDNLNDFISNVDKFDIKKTNKMPKFPNKHNVHSSQYLKALCIKGLRKRISNQNVNEKLYEQRLQYELDVITKMNYDDYFLIVWDFVRYSRENDILVGPGRGSAAGSLVSYCLGITNIDPIRYNLLFERFLNPERITMPDIDIDFPDDKRDAVINYVKEFYGKNNVCTITTFGTFQVKSSIREIAKIFKISEERTDVIIQSAENTDDYDGLLERMISNEEVYQTLKIAKKIERLPRHTSTHPSAIVVSDTSLFDMIPMQNVSDNMYQSQLEHGDLEELGLLKIDFLGLKNLTVIHNVMSEISMSPQMLNNINLSDDKTFNTLQQADTFGIFQLEGDGFKDVLRKLKPTKMDDIVAVLALYRPGPMASIPEFIKRRKTGKYELLHPDLKDILSETYGIIVYQEQIMQILLKFAKYSLAEADLIRRAISKKNENIIIEERNKFLTSCVSNGYPKEVAMKIYDLIVKFADYGFNKSHAVAYAYIAYQMAYLKTNHYAVFMKKMLDNAIGSTSTTANYINHIKRNTISSSESKLTVVGPNINESSFVYKSHKEKNLLYFPLQAVFSLGLTNAKKIISERDDNGKFTSYSDFVKRVPEVNSRTLEMLIYAGAFDSFDKTKMQLIENKQSNTDVIDKYLNDVIEVNEEYSVDILREKEKQSIGVNLKYDVFNNLIQLLKKHKTTSISNIKNNDSKEVIILINKIREFTDKNGNLMAFIAIDDGLSKNETDAVIFSNVYDNIKSEINTNELLLVNITKRIDYKTNKESIIINDVKEIQK